MKLLLTSGGITNKSIEAALLELTEKPFSELNLVFIPTAANVEKGDKTWLADDLNVLKKLGFKQIKIVDISVLSKDVWLPSLEESDVIYVEGGNNFYLMHWIKRSGLKDVLLELLKARVYVGVSAGSMVMCPNGDLKMAERLWQEEVGEYDEDEALGYVDFLIRPHLNSASFPMVTLENLEAISKENPETFYALDDESAVKIVDGKIEVISEGIWKRFN